MAIISVIIFTASLLQAETPFKWNENALLVRRAVLKDKAMTNLQENSNKTIQTDTPGTLSVRKAVLLSALVPGGGQLYSGSYIKSALFFGVEIGAWILNITYNKKGKDKDTEFKTYADAHWSEQQYFSYVYYKVGPDEFGRELPITVDAMNRPIISNSAYTAALVNELRNYEQEKYAGSGFTHHLPTTKTQQYYEMIGKYPAQFGNGWDDASFLIHYDGYTGSMTPRNAYYMDMRDESNHFYKVAGYGSMTALVNHVVSAIDAGFTARRHNRQQELKVEMSYQNIPIQGEYVDMFGINMGW